MSIYDELFDVDAKLLHAAIIVFLDEETIQKINEAIKQMEKLQKEFFSEQLSSYLTEKLVADIKTKIELISVDKL